ncbi:hypothetical protein LOD99_10174 [Oopsacas minuta]|uniref:Uncharacterized protein n=1 Tax=Oopsacas minuta TaxID=111878 RepID=A0AAV7KID4_9METZ|nr:hypothetical protein LOD99_10174 [Oopsacas minuta]
MYSIQALSGCVTFGKIYESTRNLFYAHLRLEEECISCQLDDHDVNPIPNIAGSVLSWAGISLGPFLNEASPIYACMSSNSKSKLWVLTLC